MKKILASLSVVILAAVIFCTTVFAQSAEIKTSVPKFHTVTLTVEGCGKIIADGEILDGEILVERLTTEDFILSPDDGHALLQVICDGKDVTELVRDGVFTLEAINHDTELTVIFTAAADESETSSHGLDASQTSDKESLPQSKDESTDTIVSIASYVSDSASEVSSVSGDASGISSAFANTSQASKAQMSDGDKAGSVTTGDHNAGVIFIVILAASCVLILLCVRKQKPE